MAETLSKLRPDRDLQCYFQQPSAIAALSGSSASGFTVSGCWRQQFDWAVVEWNRDNVIEHPALRNLPDGDLSALSLTYRERRTNCVPLDATTYDSVGWSFLRIWEESGGIERFHWVPLKPYATPVSGAFVPAKVEFELQGTPTAGDYIELAWLDRHFNYLVTAGDTIETCVAGLAGFINQPQAASGVTATADGTRIELVWSTEAGANGNRVGVYGTVHGAGTEGWSPAWGMFAGGVSPDVWQVDLDFNSLTDTDQQRVVTSNVRKLRWTWAADLQFGAFERGEFAVEVNDWAVTGTNTGYRIAGPGSRRIESGSKELAYYGNWTEERGNYSCGSIRRSGTPGNSVECRYLATAAHELFVGTRLLGSGGRASVQVDGGTPKVVDLRRPLEDTLVRIPAGTLGGQAEHVVTVTHAGDTGSEVHFEFLEIAVPTQELPVFEAKPKTTLATDWDTNHSLAIPPERSAWLMQSLGFKGRANHYAGSMWFYELRCAGNQYASATVSFDGAPEFGGTTEIALAGTTIQHLNLIGDTAESIARCFELLITAGSSAVWAKAEGAVLTVTARAMGTEGNQISLAAGTNSSEFTAAVSHDHLSGGSDGQWLTDLTATPRLNRAARDWSRSYFQALRGYGIDVAAAFSLELRHGDDSPKAGIAQRYPDGPVWLNTPALQTNFSPASRQFWDQVYVDMAQVMAEAGCVPYLQFGEVQWWYFANGAGMPFYDDYTKATFQSIHGRPPATIGSQFANPSQYADECAFLPGLIGQFTNAIMTTVREAYPQARFEVLYPPDTNDTPLNRLVNYPAADWTPAALDCLKTENFTFTGNRDLDKARFSLRLPVDLGFPAAKRSHLVGIGDCTSPWDRERELAVQSGVESVVLFALDQFCLIGYGVPLRRKRGRTQFMGA